MAKELMSPATRAESSPAPRWRQTLARALDAAIVGAGAWLWRRGTGTAGARQARWARLSGPAATLLGEQLRSPGQRLFGLRTVDRRTGRRPELWRALVLLGAGVGGQLLVRRLAPGPMTPEQVHDRDGFLDELNAIQARHPDDPVAREAERRALLDSPHDRLASSFLRAAGPTMAIGLLNIRLRRRLAPTTQVLVARGEPHSP